MPSRSGDRTHRAADSGGTKSDPAVLGADEFCTLTVLARVLGVETRART